MANDDDTDMYIVENGLLKRSYLILCPTTYKESIKNFSAWKKLSGFQIITEYNESWTPTSIEAKIDSVYNSVKTLQYVLLIGDQDVMPGKKFYSTYTCFGSYLSDYEYSQVAPSLERSVYIGRIPGRNKEEIESALEKIIKYEKTPPLNSEYYSRSLHNAYFQPSSPSYIEERRFVRTVEDVRNYVNGFGIEPEYNYFAPSNVSPKYWSASYADGTEIPSSLQRPNYTWDGNTITTVDFFNKSGLYVLYRGHGFNDYWDIPRFSVKEISTLSESGIPPMVFSVTCLSGRYDYPAGGFAQSLINKKNGGCIGVIAASETSYSGLNDALINGMFNQWFKGEGFNYNIGHNVYLPEITQSYVGVTLGEILEGGLERMYEIYPSSLMDNSKTNYNRNIFHIFGDPSMMLHTKQPTPFTGLKTELRPGAGYLGLPPGFFAGTFNLSLDEDGIISITDANNKTVTYFGNAISIRAPYLPLNIVITGHNKVPLLYTYYNFDGSGAPSSYLYWKFSSVAPNPTPGKVSATIVFDPKLKAGQSDSSKLNIPQIYSMEIILISTESKAMKHFSLKPEPQTVSIDFSELPTGSYIMALIVDGVKTDTRTIIKAN